MSEQRDDRDEQQDTAYYDETLLAWCCGDCGAVLRGDGDCPRCDGPE